jgi:hypothetical protein
VSAKPKWPWEAIGLTQGDYYQIKHPPKWPASWGEDGPDIGEFIQWSREALHDLADAERVSDAVMWNAFRHTGDEADFKIAHADQETALVSAIRVLHHLTPPEAFASVIKDVPPLTLALAFGAIVTELFRLLDMARIENLESDDTMRSALQRVRKMIDEAKACGVFEEKP